VNYQQALDYLYSFINYEKSGMPAANPAAYNLERIALLLELLGNPQASYPSIMIAGTKGKGSTAVLCASALQEAGYRVGLYSQPHLHTYRERIRVDGALISREEVVALVERLKPYVEQTLEAAARIGRITTYELGTALALQHFADAGVDIAILEVGLGGRLDAVNVVTPLVSVISSISYDHVEVLGETLAKIAAEKAGIIKSGGLVISASQPPEAMSVIESISRERGAKLYRVGEDFTFYATDSVDITRERIKPVHPIIISAPANNAQIEVSLLLRGAHQYANAALAFGALLLQAQSPKGLPITTGAIKAGFEKTQWEARLEVLQDTLDKPLVIADGAHNAESAARLREALASTFNFEKLVFVVGSSSDKDIEGVFRELRHIPAPVSFILTRSRHPRAAALTMLRDRGFSDNPQAPELVQNIAMALEEAHKLAGKNDLICVTGSLFVAAEAREYYGLALESDGSPD
jgi:dihydrofolate synthase/folylpolyglutamate synthase